MSGRLLAPFARLETYRALLFYLGGVVLGGLGLVVVIAGWSLTLGLAVTPLVFPLLFGLRWAVGLLAVVTFRATPRVRRTAPPWPFS